MVTVTVNVKKKTGLAIDISQLPVTHTVRGDKFSGILLLIAGAVWASSVVAMLVAIGVLGGFDRTGAVVLLALGTLGSIPFLSGVNELSKVTSTTIDKHQISYFYRSLLSSKQWVEELSGYEGLLYREEYHAGGKHQRSYTLYTVELHHQDKDKVIKFFQSTSSQGVRAVQEDLCRRLSLPAVEKDGSNLAKREVEDLDKSICELVREGKVSIDFDPSSSPPKGLQAVATGDTLQIIVKKDEFSVVNAVILLAIPGVFIFIGLANKGALPMLLIGTVVGLVMAAQLLRATFTRASLRIGPGTVSLIHITPWRETTVMSLRTAEIRHVVVRETRGLGEVLISTGPQQMAIGRGLSSDALQWLKNCIVTTVSA
jgi:hypothetical protein